MVGTERTSKDPARTIVSRAGIHCRRVQWISREKLNRKHKSHASSVAFTVDAYQPINQPTSQASKQASSIHRQLVASLPTPHFTGERRRVQSDLRRKKRTPTTCSKQSIHEQLYLYPSFCTSSVVVVVAVPRFPCIFTSYHSTLQYLRVVHMLSQHGCENPQRHPLLAKKRQKVCERKFKNKNESRMHCVLRFPPFTGGIDRDRL